MAKAIKKDLMPSDDCYRCGKIIIHYDESDNTDLCEDCQKREFYIILTKQQYRVLDKIAEKMEVTLSELVRRAVDDYTKIFTDYDKIKKSRYFYDDPEGRKDIENYKVYPIGGKKVINV